MPANPFEVTPLGGFTGGAQLQAMGEKLEDRRVVQEKRDIAQRIAEKTAALRSKAADVFQRGDPDEINRMMFENPELGESFQMAQGWSDEIEREVDLDEYRRMMTDRKGALDILGQRAERLEAAGQDATDERELLEMAKSDPERFQEMFPRLVGAEYAALATKQEYDSFKTDLYEGLSSEYETYLRANQLQNTPENYAKFKTRAAQDFAPSGLKKLINERQGYIDEGYDESDAVIKAYDAKISGVDIDIEDMTQDEIDMWGKFAFLGGKLPSFGRGKQSTKIRVAIAKSAARQALGADEAGIPDVPDKTPAEAALAMLGEQSDTKAIQGSLNFLDKQLSSMGSFVVNLNSQIDKVTELSKDLKTFDSRFLNAPLRAIRGRLVGSALQAKYDLYLSEIESEIGKLATGATSSVAELSASAQEKWSQIHDKNLSVSDMLELLEETKHAANFRVASVQGQLDKTRARMRRSGILPEQAGTQTVTTQEEYDALPSGAIFTEDGAEYRKP